MQRCNSICPRAGGQSRLMLQAPLSVHSRTRFYASGAPLFRSFWVLFFRSFFDRILGSFWVPFGVPFGWFSGSKSCKNRSWTLVIFQKVVFHEILAPPIEFEVFSPQLAPQNDPKSTHEAPKRIFFCASFSSSFLERFRSHFGSQNASRWAPFSVPKSIPKTIKI